MAIQISSSFSSSAKIATVYFGIAELEVVVAMRPSSVTQLRTGWTNRAVPKDIMCNASKEHICHHREFDVR